MENEGGGYNFGIVAYWDRDRCQPPECRPGDPPGYGSALLLFARRTRHFI
jgi:hypothetical protein